MTTQASSSIAGLCVAVLRRRLSIVLPFALVTPLAAFVVAGGAPSVYQARSQVLLQAQYDTSGLGRLSFATEDRDLNTQAEIAGLPAVAERVERALEASREERAAVRGTSVNADSTTDLLTFRTRAREPEIASRVAAEYARQYVAFRRELDTAALRRAASVLGSTLQTLRRTRDRNSGLYGSTADKYRQVQTALTVQGTNASVVQVPTQGAKIEPRPANTALHALALGLVVGLGLAFLAELLDIGVRSADEVADELGLPLLGRLAPSTRMEMITDPWSVEAEHVRMVRSGLERELRDDCTSLLVTSATEDDGASAAVANLAIALARAGRRATVVDLDLRAPALHTLFGVERAPGMADAARGIAAVGAVARAVEVDGPGEVLVVPAGSPPPSPSEVLSSPLLSAELAELGARSDVVLIDGPPLLIGGDALELTTRVDAVLFVASVRGFRRSYAGDLRRLLAAAPARTLGVIVVDHTIGQPARRSRRSRRPEKATYATG